MSEIFADRIVAGQKLAERLAEGEIDDAIVLGIPKGGVPVAGEIAARLHLPFDLVMPRKLPIPWNPEAGFGAVTSDGAVILNEPIIQEIGLSRVKIRKIIERIQDEIKQTEKVFRIELPKLPIENKHVIIVDDGVASGYTMLAAVQSARQAGARRITVAVPVASESAVRLIEKSADELVCLIVSHHLPFAVADYYLRWHDLNDEDVVNNLSDIRRRSTDIESE